MNVLQYTRTARGLKAVAGLHFGVQVIGRASEWNCDEGRVVDGMWTRTLERSYRTAYGAAMAYRHLLRIKQR